MSETEKKRNNEKLKLSRESSRESLRDSSDRRLSERRLSDRRLSDTRGSDRRDSSRSTSSYGGTISDIESEDYRRLSKKLAKDKEKLKDKLRRLLDDIENRSEEHKREMEKTQNYFEEQINDITEERDTAQDALEDMRNLLIQEKEKIRQNFEDKLNKHKEALEKRYGAKDSQVVKRLENTIVALQERINQQIEERERSKDNTEQYYSQREENLRQNITDLEEQIRKVKEAHMKDRQDMNKTIKTFTDEKEFVIAKIKKDKDEEISSLIAEKNAAFVSLQSLKDQIEKRAKNADAQRDEEVCKMKFEVAETKRAFESKLSDSTISFKNSVAEIKQQYEGKLYSLDQQHKTELEQKRKEYENNIYNISGESSRKIEQIISETESKLLEQNNIIARLNKQIEAGMGADSKRYEQVICELQSQYENKDREFKESYLRHEKIVGELNDTNNRLKEQLSIVKDNTKKLQDYSQTVNSQMIGTITKQKEQAEKDLSTRDMTIDKLERQLKKVSEETIDRVNTLERKLKNTIDDLKEITDKYTTTKLALDKKEKDLLLQKDEISRVKESNDLYTEKLRKSHFEKELLESKVKTFEDMVKNKDVSTEAEKTRNNQLYSQTQSLQIKLKEMEFELERKNKSTKTLQTELDTANKSLAISISENNKIRNQLSDDLKKAVSSVTLEKDRTIEEIKKLHSQVEHTYKFQIIQKDKEMDTLRSQFADNIRKEISRITTEKDKQLEEYKKSLSQCENTLKIETRNKEQDIESAKNRLNDSHNQEISRISTEKDRLVEELKKKTIEFETKLLSESRTKEAELQMLKDKMTELNRLELSKISTEKDKVAEDLKKKNTELETKLLSESRTKEAELQMLKDKMSELSRLELSKVSTEKDRLIEEIKKKNTELEKKLFSESRTKEAELQILKDKMAELNRLELSKMSSEKDKITEEIKKKNVDLENKLLYETRNKEVEFQLIRDKMSEINRVEMFKVNAEKNRIVDEFKKKNTELETKLLSESRAKEAELQMLKDKMTELSRIEVSKVSTEKDRLIEEIKRKNTELEKKLASESSSRDVEIQNAKNKISEATRQELAKVTGEKDRHIEELKKRIAILEKDISLSLHETMKNINMAKEELRKDHSKTITEKERFSEELQKRISQLEHDLLIQTQLKQKLTEQVENAKKEREELFQLRNEIAKLTDRSVKYEQQQNVLQESKNRLQESVTKLNYEHAQQIQKLNDKLQDVTKRLHNSEELYDKTKLAYNAFVESESKKNGPDVKNKLNELEKERDYLLTQLASSDKKIQQLQYDIAAATATLRVKSQSLDERESILRKNEEAIRTAPPKLLDPSIKKSRDDALIHLRQSKLELSKVKEETTTLAQKLTVAEETITDLEKEKNIILKSQSEIKQTFVDNLNRQQQQHEKELLEKNSRIKELEEMLLTKIKN